MPFDGPLKFGDAIGVTRNGDLELGATGTATHIDGDAFTRSAIHTPVRPDFR